MVVKNKSNKNKSNKNNKNKKNKKQKGSGRKVIHIPKGNTKVPILLFDKNNKRVKNKEESILSGKLSCKVITGPSNTAKKKRKEPQKKGFCTIS
tara:strand:- start:2848 stop:3129 length:282 start_codon:yes stop_codon:yes gene_type:complete